MYYSPMSSFLGCLAIVEFVLNCDRLVGEISGVLGVCKGFYFSAAAKLTERSRGKL
jgi:hypothetical protein